MRTRTQLRLVRCRSAANSNIDHSLQCGPSDVKQLTCRLGGLAIRSSVAAPQRIQQPRLHDFQTLDRLLQRRVQSLCRVQQPRSASRFIPLIPSLRLCPAAHSTPSMVLPRLLLACACAVAALSIAVAENLPQTFELSTVRPQANSMWPADEWLVDFSTADDNGNVNAQLRTADFVSLPHASNLPISWRGDAAARMPGLDSVYFLHHNERSTQNIDWMWFFAPVNSTSVAAERH